MISSMAQPETNKIREKITRKNNYEKEKLVDSQKKIWLNKMQNLTKASKSVDWWEPATVFQYYDYENETMEIRRSFSYDKGKCTVDLWQIKEENQWENTMRFTYQYDIQNNMTENKWQSWNKKWEQWEGEEVIVFTFDAYNNLISEAWG